MAGITVTASLQALLSITDNLGSGYGGKPVADGSPQNANAPPPTSQLLAIGNNTITVPAGYTVNGVWVRSSPSSTNAKTFKGITGDTGFTQVNPIVPVFVPVASGASFVISSPAAEMVEIFYV